MLYEKIILGTDDVFRRQLLAGGEPVETMPAVSRITLRLGSTLIDSAVSPEAFDWDTYAADAIVVFKLGHEPIPPGAYLGVLRVYSSDNPDGLENWGPIPVSVRTA